MFPIANSNCINVTIKDLAGEEITYSLSSFDYLLLPLTVSLSGTMSKNELKQRMDADGLDSKMSKAIWQLYETHIYRLPKLGTVFDMPLKNLLAKAQSAENESEMDNMYDVYSMVLTEVALKYNPLAEKVMDMTHDMYKVIVCGSKMLANVIYGADMAYAAVKMLALISIYCGHHYDIGECFEKEGGES